jgi:DNA-binding CsgD family transcriptional regulator
MYVSPYADKVAELTRAGHSATEISALLGCSVRAVVRCRRITGTSKGPGVPRVSADKLAQAELLVADGASCREVARTIGVHSKTVKKYFPESVWSKQQQSEMISAIQKYRHVLK